MKKPQSTPDPLNRNDFTVAAPIMKDGLPTGGGLGGVKRMQLQQAGGLRDPAHPSSTANNTGIVPPKAPTYPARVSTNPAGYEQSRPASFNQRLSALTSPNFPRRRGQG